MKPLDNECHFLLFHEVMGDRPVYLSASTYALGRDPKNSIPLHSRSVSREHALLLRMPNPQTGRYQYRLLDGNASGKPSLNGFTINGFRRSVHDLISGDRIVFGGEIEVTYQIQVAPPERAKAIRDELFNAAFESREYDTQLFTELTAINQTLQPSAL